jgi:hypothetical protein
VPDNDFLDKLRRDLLEQFKGKPNIEVFQRALARQLSDLYEFFSELNTLRWLQTAEGIQLDGIGDIVVMSRTDALVVARLVGKNVPMDDVTYRLYLAFKIHLNTSNCTHRDVYRALKMFWDKTPLYYSEKIEHPATMFISTPTLNPDIDVSPLFLAPKVKAAGVALYIVATTETPLDPLEMRVAGVIFPGIMITKLPLYVKPHAYDQDVNVSVSRASVGVTKLDPFAPEATYEENAAVAVSSASVGVTKLSQHIPETIHEKDAGVVSFKASIVETKLDEIEGG